MTPRRTARTFAEELPELLSVAGISFRELARRIEIDQAYVSLVVNRKRAPSRKLLERSAKILGLEPEYWREYREQVAIEAIRSDPELLDRVFQLIVRRR